MTAINFSTTVKIICIYRSEKVCTLIYFSLMFVTLIPSSSCVVCCQVLLEQSCILDLRRNSWSCLYMLPELSLLTGRNVCITQVRGSDRLKLLKHWPHWITDLTNALSDWVCFADTTSSRSVMGTQKPLICWENTAVTSPRQPSSHLDPCSTSDLCLTMPTREPASHCDMRSTKRVRDLHH